MFSIPACPSSGAAARCTALLLVALTVAGCSFNPVRWFAGLFGGEEARPALAVATPAAPAGRAAATAGGSERSCYRDGRLLLLDDGDCARMGGMMVDVPAGPAKAPHPEAVPVPPVQAVSLPAALPMPTMPRPAGGVSAPVAVPSAPVLPPATVPATQFAPSAALVAPYTAPSPPPVAGGTSFPPVPSYAAAVRGRAPAAAPTSNRADPVAWGSRQPVAERGDLIGTLPDGARVGMSETTGSRGTMTISPHPRPHPSLLRWHRDRR